MATGLTTYVEAVERPLRFIAEGGRTSIGKIKNLGKHMVEVSEEALGEIHDPIHLQRFRELKEIFHGFDDLNLDEKWTRVHQALKLVRHEEREKLRCYRPEDYIPPTRERLLEAKKKLWTNVQYVKGVGPAIAEKLRKARVLKINDLLLFLPHRFEDRRKVTRVKDLQEGGLETVVGEVFYAGVAYYRGLRRRVYEATIDDGSGKLKLKWFHFSAPSMDSRLKKGSKVIVYGKPKKYRSAMEMHHPDLEVYTGKVDSISFGRIVPVYSEVGGLYQKTLRKILYGAVSQYAGSRLGLVPTSLARKRDLLAPWKAIRELHHPTQVYPTEMRNDPARSLAYEELFFYCLALALRKKQNKKEKGIAFGGETPSMDPFIQKLPFELTRAQEEVFEKIREDMALGSPMNRLLQGDVGSGKTVVAFLAALIAMDQGHQVAVMAPTEILAEQHLRVFQTYAEWTGKKVALITGRLRAAERRELLRQVADHEINLVVGTHALLEGDVFFPKLGLVVVDEQHRFGVRQRDSIRKKAKEPDVLVMSATPIPRTLALTLYGDVDVSILNQLPKGRKPIQTRVFGEGERGKVYEKIREELNQGHQVYFVYPLVEESQLIDLKDVTSMTGVLKKEFSKVRVEMIHGQMLRDEKEKVMKAFFAGEIQVLVSTTVIEVGIDVSNATLMVIEHPERFGLSQLHQLRGRVGRGGANSFCYLIRPARISQQARERLDRFSQLHDGFLLAEEDLKMRGPGDFFGVAQSGIPLFASAIFPRDLDLLERSRLDAFELLNQDPEFRSQENRHLPLVVREFWQDRLQLVKVG